MKSIWGKIAFFCLLASAPASAQPSPQGAPGQVEVEIVASLQTSVGNVAVTPDNQIIFSQHPFYQPDIRVSKLTSATTSEPWPSLAWNTPRKTDDHYLDNVLGLRADETGVIWMIDMGFRTHITPKLVGWNALTNKLERIYYMPAPVTRASSQPQDIVIDRKHRKFYIADEDAGPGGDGSRAAIIVIDMDTGVGRRVLEGDRSTAAENYPIVAEGRELVIPTADGKTRPLTIGCDGITMDHKAEWVYFSALNSRSIWRIRTSDLNDASLSPEKLSSKVERYSGKPTGGSISMDYAGNIYANSEDTRSVDVITADGKSAIYATHPDMVSPDGLAYAPDGFYYGNASQVAKAAIFNGGVAGNRPPYVIYRFKPIEPAFYGR